MSKIDTIWGIAVSATHFTINFCLLLFIEEIPNLPWIALCVLCYAMLWFFILEYKRVTAWDETWRKELETSKPK